jgi:hypothetical protein
MKYKTFSISIFKYPNIEKKRSRENGNDFLVLNICPKELLKYLQDSGQIENTSNLESVKFSSILKREVPREKKPWEI